MIIKEIALENWGPYFGKQSIQLGPSYYGIEARNIHDDSASNGNGKSLLMEAFPFAIWGWLNPDRGFGVDGWISDSQTRGGVKITFDDGWWISRERDNSFSKEKELVSTSTGTKGKEAVLEAEARLGLSCDDLFAARFLRQRQAARFVLAKPEERMGIVSDWLRLGPLEQAEKIASKFASDAEKAVIIAQHNLDMEKAVLSRQGDPTELQSELTLVSNELENATESAQLASAFAKDAADSKEHSLRGQESANRYLLVVEEGKKLRDSLKEKSEETLVATLDIALGLGRSAVERHTLAFGAKENARRLSRGEFDGLCPLAGIQCPAKKQINVEGKKNLSRYSDAEKELEEASENLDLKEAAARGFSDELERLRIRKSRLEDLRRTAIQLKPFADIGTPSPEDIQQWDSALLEASRKSDEVRRLDGEVRRLEDSLKSSSEVQKRVDDASKVLGEAERKLRIAREGAALFKTTRKKIAENALSKIERDANLSLDKLTSGLSFELSWSRAGSGFAKTCNSCGEPFPISTKVRICSRCKGERGPNMVEKLELILSKQSGALEDLIGVFLSISSAHWLSSDRGSQFSTMFFDEITSFLDKSHRDALARKLPAILSSLGVEQSFIISHDSASIAALPGRILVESNGSTSTVRVIT